MTKFELVESRLEEVKQDYGNISPKILEIKYNASYGTIQRVLKKYGVIKGKPEQIKYKYIREHEDEFIQDWINGILSKEELEDKYKCPYTVLQSRSNELRIKRLSIFNKKEKCLEIASNWILHELSNSEICNKYNISISTLHRIINSYNLNTGYKWNGRKYFFNEKYFDIIDNEHKAYWLGFIYADGSHNPERYSLMISLCKDDENILKQFYKDIECDRDIKYTYNKKYNKYYPYVYVQHPHLSSTLINMGVPGNKSFKIRFPSNDIVPDDLKRHFIRGYLDGDGSIICSKNKKQICWSIIGNYDCIMAMKQYIESKIENYPISIYKHSNNNIYKIGRGGRFVTPIFLNWLYKDATIYLNRKHNKYLEIIEYNKEKKI